MLKDLPKPGNWMTKVDLKDNYFMIPVTTDHRKLLQFKWIGETYQFTCLPFGLSLAPWVFTKTTKPIVAILRTMGLRIMPDPIRDIVSFQGANSWACISPREHGLHHQLPKIHSQTIEEDRISWLHSRLHNNGNQTENQKDKDRNQE